jgi:uncharacterized protein YukE
VADVLSVKLEAMISSAQTLADQADELKGELDSITREWGELSSTWTGVATRSLDWDQ